MPGFVNYGNNGQLVDMGGVGGAPTAFQPSPAAKAFLAQQDSARLARPLPGQSPEDFWASPEGRTAMQQWYGQKFGRPLEMPGPEQTRSPQESVAAAVGGYRNPAETGAAPFAARPALAAAERDRTYGGMGGAALGTDPFAQGISTLGKLPTLQSLQGMIAGPGPYTAEVDPYKSPGYVSALNNWRDKMAAAGSMYNDLLGQYRLGSEGADRTKLAAGNLALDTQARLGHLGLEQGKLDLERTKALDPIAIARSGFASSLAQGEDPEIAGQKWLGPGGFVEQSRAAVPPNQISPLMPGKLPAGSMSAPPGQAGLDMEGGLTGRPGLSTRATLEKASRLGTKPDAQGNWAKRSIADFIENANQQDPGVFKDASKFNTLVGVLRDKYGADADRWLQSGMSPFGDKGSTENVARQRVIDAYQRLGQPLKVVGPFERFFG
jgi:hypothetical protein